MQFQGERTFRLTADALCKLLGDARFLVSCLPDAGDVRAAGPDEASCSVRPQLAFMNGTLDLTVRVTDRQPPTALRFQLSNKGVGGGADVECAVQMTPAEDGTRAAWTASITRLSGLLKMVPAGLIRGAAQKVIEDVWTHIEQRAYQQAASPPST